MSRAEQRRMSSRDDRQTRACFLVCLAKIQRLSFASLVFFFLPETVTSRCAESQRQSFLNCYRPKLIFSMKKSHRRPAESFSERELKRFRLPTLSSVWMGVLLCSFFVLLPQSLFFFFFAFLFLSSGSERLKLSIKWLQPDQGSTAVVFSSCKSFFSHPNKLKSASHLPTWV